MGTVYSTFETNAHGVVFLCVARVAPFHSEGLNMKGDGGLHVGQRLIEGIALADDNAFHSQWIRDITIRVFFNDYLELFIHGFRPPLASVACAVRTK